MQVKTSDGYDNLYPQTSVDNVQGIQDQYYDKEEVIKNTTLQSYGLSNTDIPDSVFKSIKTSLSTNETDIQELQEQSEELFSSVSNGKSLIAGAITDKGISTSSTDTFSQMANNIRLIKTTPVITSQTYTNYQITLPSGYTIWENCFPVVVRIFCETNGNYTQDYITVEWTQEGNILTSQCYYGFYTFQSCRVYECIIYFIN